MSKDEKKIRPASLAAKVREEGEVARKVWLAGLGAYGRAVSDAQESLSKFGLGRSKMFDDLVRRGEEIETRIDSKRKDLSERIGTASSLPFQERVNELREKLKQGISGRDEARLEQIEERLARIERLLEDQAPTDKTKSRKTKSPAPTSRSGDE